MLAASTPAAGRITLDPSLARGLSYYTGAIMEIAVEGIGSLGGGGRYDNLVGMFLGRDVPACGFSLGLERIIVVMTEREMFPASVVKSAVDIVVTFLSCFPGKRFVGTNYGERNIELTYFLMRRANSTSRSNMPRPAALG
jgi:histidyl-tRNA synthetase